jgi:hypothetical protein
MTKTTIYKISSTALLILMVSVFTQCIGTNTKQIGSGHSTAPTPKKDVGQIINEMQVSEGMKSYEQIFHTFSTLTGVAVTQNDVRNAYNQVVTSLPTDNDIKVFLPSHQLAVTKLAAEFCHQLVETEALRTAMWPGYAGYGMNPDTGLSGASRMLIIDKIIDNFWGGMISDAERQKVEDEYQVLIGELLMGEAANSQTTRNVIKGVCTSALASAHVILI